MDDEEYAGLYCNLAQCFAEGLGTEKDVEQALELYREGADMGDALCEERYRKLEAKIMESEE